MNACIHIFITFKKVMLLSRLMGGFFTSSNESTTAFPFPVTTIEVVRIFGSLSHDSKCYKKSKNYMLSRIYVSICMYMLLDVTRNTLI